MKTLVIDNGTTLVEKLKKLIPGEESVVCFDSFSKEKADDKDLIILSGSSIGPLIERIDHYDEEIEFLKTTDKPIIGICFGYELIVHAFGGSLKQLGERKVGTVVVKVLRDKELFSGKEKFESFENHQWGTEKLPKGFEVLAESEHGPEVIRHTSRPIYGLQFHPENKVETSFGDELFLSILSKIAE